MSLHDMSHHLFLSVFMSLPVSTCLYMPIWTSLFSWDADAIWVTLIEVDSQGLLAGAWGDALRAAAPVLHHIRTNEIIIRCIQQATEPMPSDEMHSGWWLPQRFKECKNIRIEQVQCSSSLELVILIAEIALHSVETALGSNCHEVI